MSSNSPYTYLLGWSKLNNWYYGVRYSKSCAPSDLWVTYFSSSKFVKEFRKTYGDPDIILVHKVFITAKEAKLFEDTILKSIPKDNYSIWLNKCFTTFPGVLMTDTIKAAISKTKSGVSSKFILINNGIENKSILKTDQLPNGWIKGRISSIAQLNALSSLRQKLTTESRQKAGKSNLGKSRNAGKKTGSEWYSNDIIKQSKLFFSHEITPEWYKGRKYSTHSKRGKNEYKWIYNTVTLDRTRVDPYHIPSNGWQNGNGTHKSKSS